MSIKINNNTVINQNRVGDFSTVNFGSYTSSQLSSLAVTGTAVGDAVYNSTTQKLAIWTGSQWEDTEVAPNFDASAPDSATGGTKTTVGSYTVHTFTSPGTFSVTGGAPVIEYLVVAGGGGGFNCVGNQNSGGGGAGGFRSNHPGVPAPLRGAEYTLYPGNYTVTVGNGGAVGEYVTVPAGAVEAGEVGGNSTFNDITSYGGGTTAPENDLGMYNGGSGAGGFAATPGGAGNTPATVPPQGNPGATGNPYNNSTGVGGGGAGGPGTTAGGGPGITFDFPGAGTPATYAVGGNGSQQTIQPVQPGTGNGGSSSYNNLSNSRAGSPGIVIVRYLTAT